MLKKSSLILKINFLNPIITKRIDEYRIVEKTFNLFLFENKPPIGKKAPKEGKILKEMEYLKDEL